MLYCMCAYFSESHILEELLLNEEYANMVVNKEYCKLIENQTHDI